MHTPMSDGSHRLVPGRFTPQQLARPRAEGDAGPRWNVPPELVHRSAMRDTGAEIASLKAGVSIVRIIGETLALKRHGRCTSRCAPSTQRRRRASQSIPTTFHCFGCGAHGDVFDWLMRAHRMTFPRRLHISAVVCGILLPSHLANRPPAVRMTPSRLGTASSPAASGASRLNRKILRSRHTFITAASVFPTCQ